MDGAASRPSANLPPRLMRDRKSTRLNSSHLGISYAVFCLKKKKTTNLNIYTKQKIATTKSRIRRHTITTSIMRSTSERAREEVTKRTYDKITIQQAQSQAG